MTASPRSTSKPYDLAVYIGRFQIFHEGHLSVVKNAVEHAEHVLILVGSANRSRDTRNPFTYEERQAMIREGLHDLAVEKVADGSSDPAHVGIWSERINSRVTICPLDDMPYDKAAWITAVQVAARSATTAVRPRVCLTGNHRDATSEYLTWFPAWDFLPSKDTAIEATTIRKHYFAGGVNFHQTGWTDDGVVWGDLCPPATIKFLEQFRQKPEYAYLMRQKAAEEAYRAKWGPGPFQTVDPVIIKGDHVLMIERGGEEGAGMMGLPGGFLEAGETLLQGCVREAVEETMIFLPEVYHEPKNDGLIFPAKTTLDAAHKALLQYQRGRGERFDDPHRSRRGHLITEAFLFVLPDGHGFPPVRGGDDAKRAFWMPISEVRGDNTFEDHAFILDRMLSLHA